MADAATAPATKGDVQLLKGDLQLLRHDLDQAVQSFEAKLDQAVQQLKQSQDTFMTQVMDFMHELHDTDKKWKEEIIVTVDEKIIASEERLKRYIDVRMENFSYDFLGAQKDRVEHHHDRLKNHERRIKRLETHAGVVAE